MNARLPITRLIAESLARPSGKIVRRKPLAFALEPRIMFDGAAVDTAVAVVDAPPPVDAAAIDASHTETATAESTPTDVQASEVTAPVVLREADPALNNGRREAVFIDTSVADYRTLADAVRPGVEIVLVEGGQSGLAQMAAWAETHRGYDSIALVGHGAEGVQKIGGSYLDSTAFADAATQAQLQKVGAALTAEGDILLYGCSVAEGETGQRFVEDFAALTGADVAASTDVTGASGNWILERNTGAIDEGSPFDVSSLDSYDGNLQQLSAWNRTSDEVALAYVNGTLGASLTGSWTVKYAAGPNFNYDMTFVAYYQYSAGPSINQAVWLTGTQSFQPSVTYSSPYYETSSTSGGGVTFYVTATGAIFSPTHAGTLRMSNVSVKDAFANSQGFSPSQWLAVNPNTAPTFVGGTSQALSTAVDASAQDLSSYLHVSDSDASQTETWTQSSAPSHGTLNISSATASSGSTDITPGGTVTYTPTAGYTGTDTFSIQVSDGNGGTATKSFTVTVNDAPTITGASAGQTVNDTGTLSPFSGVTIADSGTSQTQTVSVTLDNAAKGSFTTLNGFANAGGGVYSFSGTAAAATAAIRGLVFNPADNRVAPHATETATFTISTSDGVASAVSNNTTTVVSTSMNDAPTGIALSNSSINENTADGTVVGALSTTDPDTGDGVSYTVMSGGAYFYVFQGNLLGRGNLDYETAASHAITIRAIDSSSAYREENFTVTIGNINDAPTLTGLDAVAFAENTVNAGAQTIDGAVTLGDIDSTDFNGGNLTANWSFGGTAQDQLTVGDVASIAVSGGTVSYNGNAIGTVSGGTNGASLSVSFNSASATPTAVQALIQALQYQNTSNNPAASRTLSVTVSDGDGGTSTAATAVITVTAENDAPTVSSPPTISATEDTQYTLTTASFNFTDVDSGNSLQSVQILTLPANGGLTLSGAAVQAGDTISRVNLDAGNLKWSPVAQQNGNAYAAFTYKVGDGTTASVATYTATINVAAVNDVPTDIALSNISVAENSATGTVVGNLSSTDVDIATNSQTHTYSLVGGATSKFQISGSQLQVMAGANLDYETATSHSVTVRSNDGNGGTFDKSFTIAVANVNDPPSVTINEGLTVTQGTTATINASRLIAFDGEQTAGALTYTIGTAPLRGTLYKSGVALSDGGTFTQADINNGLVTYSHNIANAQVSDSFTFTVADGVSGSTASTTFNIAVNRHPVVANALIDQSWSGSGAKTYQFAGNAFTDADSDTLSYSARQASGSVLPAWLSFNAGTRTFSGNPPVGIASVDVRVTAVDGKGGTQYDDFTITLSNANDTATVANTIPDQTWTGSGAKSYQVPAGTFSLDPDGDALSYAATLSGGGALPSWLTFNTTTRTFSGNPPSGTAFYDIAVTASDGNGGNVSDTFRLNLNTVNDAPVVLNPLQPQTASGPGVWSYTIPSDTFGDADNDTLTWSATQVDGSALPAWLSFNNGTLVLAGNAPNNLPQVDVKIAVTDGNGGSASSSFLLTIDQSTSNDTPAVSHAIPDATWTGSGSKSYQVPANTFFDADGDTLTLSATQSNGNALPGWLGFNPANWTFSGNPPATANGQTFAITVTANDNEGGTITDTFNLTIATANDTPTLANGIADQSHSGSGTWTYQAPANTFADADAGDGFTYAATQADDSALPAWLSFNASTRTFSGNPPNGISAVLLKVTATDNFSASVFSTFTLRISNQNDAPILANPIPAQHMSGPGAWSYTVAANTFTDADSTDTLTWSAAQTDDSALPSWLSFNAATREFTGNPPWGAPSIALKVSVDDGNGGTAYSTFLLTIDQLTTNDTPHVANALANQTWTGSGGFTWQVPANTFSDADGEALTLSATQTGGAALPSWLTFNAGTWSFTGNPPNGVSSLPITVTATDAQSASITSAFTLTIVTPNDTPTVAQALTDKSHSGAGNWSYTVPANTFADADAGDTLAWSATQADGAALPSWLTFNTSTRTFGGNPPNNLPSIALKVTGTDSQGATVGSSFTLAIASANDTPTLANALTNQSTTSNVPISYQFAAGTFADSDVGDGFTYRATLTTGAALPAWLTFNAATRTFNIAPGGADFGDFQIRVTAADSQGAEVTGNFLLHVDPMPPPTAPQPPEPTPIPSGKDSGGGGTPTEGPLPPDSPLAPALEPLVSPGSSGGGGGSVGEGGGLGSGTGLGGLFGIGGFGFGGSPSLGSFLNAPAVIAVPGEMGGANRGGNTSISASFTAPGDGAFRVPVMKAEQPALLPFRPVADVNVPVAEPGTFVAFSVPPDSFVHTNPAAVIFLQATQASGQALPGWLRFDPASGKFEGRPPPGTEGVLLIKVIARDAEGREAATLIKVNLRGGVERSDGLPRGRAGLSEQIRLAKGRHTQTERFAMLQKSALVGRRAA